METNLDIIYAPNNITPYPEGMRIEDLTHSYDPTRMTSGGREINFQAAYDLVSKASDEATSEYSKRYREEFDKFNLSHPSEARQLFYINPSFQAAFEELGISWELHGKVNLPWYNEVGAAEVEHTFNGVTAHVKLGPIHSLEGQLGRSGVSMPAKFTSIEGLVITKGDAESPEGYITLGVRGGHAFRNTYHVVAAGSSIKASDELKAGTESIYDVFLRSELEPEVGEGVGERIIRARPVSRNVDHIANNGGTTYTFAVETDLSRREIHDLWVTAKDGKEHSELLFIPATKSGARRFVESNFRGFVDNNDKRPNDQRYLLSAGAHDLAAFAGMTPADLRKLHKEGVW